MHTLHRIYKGCDIVVSIGASITKVEIDSAPTLISLNGQTLSNIQSVVDEIIEKLRYEQWLFINRPAADRRPFDNGVTEIHANCFICNRCGARAPYTGCVECD